jgi:uncharacterized repeat protein (TIGR01451 family)
MVKRVAAVSSSVLLGAVLFFGLAYLLALAAPPARATPESPGACTSINSDIQVDTTWSDACYQVMTSTVTVLPTATLTLQPPPGGMQIQFDASAQLQVLGNFKGLGASDRPITFTSNALTPQPCDWVGVIFDDTGTGDILTYGVVEYARVGLKLNGSRNVTVTHNILRLNGCGGSLDGAITGDTDNSLLFDNVIYSSTTGILLNESGSNLIVSNTIYGINYYGLRFMQGGVGGGGDNVIRDNVIHHAVSGALRLEDGSANQVLSNTLYLNPGGAVDLQKQPFAMLRYNTIYSNGGGSGYVAAVRFSDNSALSDVIGNVIHDAVGDALYFASNTTNSLPATTGNALCALGYETRNDSALALSAPGNWWGVNAPTLGAQYLGTVNPATPITLGWITATGQLPADGLSSAMITVTLRDPSGNTVPRKPVRTFAPPAPDARLINLTTTGGVLNPATVIVNDQGVATATLTSANSIGTALLTAQAFCGFTVTAPIDFVATDVAITKTTAITTSIAGSVFPYTITYSNLSGVPALGVVITDILPPALRYVSDNSGLSCPACLPGATGTLTWTVGSLPANTTQSFVLNVSAAAATCGVPVTNTAAIGTLTAEVTSTNNTTTSPPVILLCTDLAIAKTPVFTTVVVGGIVPYTITYRNLSAVPAVGVVITDILPPALRYVSDNSGLSCPACLPGAAGPLTWTVGTVAANATLSFVLNTSSVTSAACSATVTNTAAIGSLTVDVNPANNLTTSAPVTLACVDLALTKTVARSIGFAGDPITYTLTFTNLSAVTAAGIIITDLLPLQTVYVTDTSGLVPAISGGLVAWAWPALPSGGTASFNLVARYNGADCTSVLTNTAGITSVVPDPNPANNFSGAVTYRLQCGRDAVVIKDDDVGPSTLARARLNDDKRALLQRLIAQPDRFNAPTAHREFVYEGDVVTYTIAVVNTGVFSITDFVLTETLPLYSTYLGTGWTQVNSRTFTLNLGLLPPGAGRVAYFVVRVQSPFPAGETQIINQVCGAGTEPDGHPEDNCGFEDTPVRPRPLRVSKSAPLCLSPGERFDYTILYSSLFTTTLSNVRVTDTLPSGVNFTAGNWTCTGQTCVQTIPAIGPLAQGSLPLPVQLSATFPYTTQPVMTNTVEIDGGSSFVLASAIDTGADLVVVKNDNIGPLSPERQALWDTLSVKIDGARQPAQPAVRTVAHPGELITYTILYVNNGVQTARNVVITETLPLYTQYVSGGWTPAGGRIYTITLGDVPPHAGGELSFIVKIDDPFPMYIHSIINRVDIGGLEAECDRGNNWSADHTPIEGGTLPALIYLPIVRGGTRVDPPPLRVSFSAANYSALESAGSATINVILNRTSAQTVTVQFATGDLTAQAGSDYTAAAGTLTFLPGQISRSFTVPILDDEVHEPDEQVRLTLSNPTVAQLGSPNPATLTIVNDDAFCPPGAVCLKSVYSPMGLAYDSAADRLFIANRDGPDGGNVKVMQVATSQTLRIIAPVLSAQGVAYDAARNRIYAVGWDWLNFIDGATYQPILRISLGNDFQAHAVAYNPATNKIYVTGYNGNAVAIVNAANGQIIAKLGGDDFKEPSYLAVNPATNKVYVSNHNKGNPSSWVTVIDGAADVVIKKVYMYFGADLYGLAVDSANNRIFVTSIGVKRVYAIDGGLDQADGYFDVWDSITHKQLPLRMVATGSVSTTTRLWLTSIGGDDNGRDQLLDLRGAWPGLSVLCSTPLAQSPERGLLYDPATARIFAASAASNVVTVLPESVARCGMALSRYVVNVTEYRRPSGEAR